MSHDLRTPLAAIKAGVGGLRLTDVELSTQDRAELLETVEESADRLDGLIGNLLDLSRIQSDSVRPHLVPVEVAELVEITLAGHPRGGDVAVDVPAGLGCVADVGLAERVLGNVVDNALQHGGRTVVRIGAGRVGDRVEIRVVDRGPGVPADQHERLFAPFQRLGDAPRGSGVGLGLAVARGLAETMHGSLAAEDTPGGGLTMVLQLPATPTQTPEEST